MVKLYIKWILDPKKDFTIDDVPTRWRTDVERALEEVGGSV